MSTADSHGYVYTQDSISNKEVVLVSQGMLAYMSQIKSPRFQGQQLYTMPVPASFPMLMRLQLPAFGIPSPVHGFSNQQLHW